MVSFQGYRIPAHDREDIVSETLQQLLREVNSPGFAVRESLESLAQTIALRRSLDYLRARRRRRAFEVEFVEEPSGRNGPLAGFASSNAGPEEALLMKERLEVRDRVLQLLSESDRELIRLRVEEDRDCREIAKRQGRSHDAVRRHWCDCMRRVAKIGERILGGPPS